MCDGDCAEKRLDIRALTAGMQTYIGCKVIAATPMDSCTFLREFKGQDTSNQDTEPGYMVVYPDGYRSWSPKRAFEQAYRLVSEFERELIG